MNKIFSAFFAVFMAFAIGIPEAEAAKRLGGGKSFGAKRQATQPMQPRQAPQAPQAAPQQGAQPGAAGAATAAGGKRWLGPVAGLLAGGLLGAMLFGGAFDGIKFMDIVIILLLAGGIFFLFRMMTRRPQTESMRREPLQYAGAGAGTQGHQPQSMPSHEPAAPMSAAPPASEGNYFPAGFDPEGFARAAKANFVRLQEANDRGDLSSLREMMTPELFSDIEAQIRERGQVAQKVEVVTLDAKVIEVVTEGDRYIASVRFNGMLKEDDGQPESFSEVWHLEKPVSGKSGWLMSGIQQD